VSKLARKVEPMSKDDLKKIIANTVRCTTCTWGGTTGDAALGMEFESGTVLIAATCPVDIGALELIEA